MSLTKKELFEALIDLDDDAQVNVLIYYGGDGETGWVARENISAVGTGDGWETADIMIDCPEAT
ncbi:MAG: hypothetical protein QM500_14390 [Methylococcales bacterium]